MAGALVCSFFPAVFSGLCADCQLFTSITSRRGWPVQVAYNISVVQWLWIILGFTEEGMLPPGIHETTLEEVREKMGWSRRRQELLEGFERALELMIASGVTRVYLDGSFVTDKDRPNDIDGCYEVSPEAESAGRLRDMYPIYPPSPSNRSRAKEMFGVDFFPAGTVEHVSGLRFLEFFQRDRELRRRGIVAIELG